MKRAYRVAFVCGVVPLLVGTSIFVLWVITRWDWLMVAGGFTLFGGFAFFAVGAIALTRFCWFAFRMSRLARRRLWIASIGCAALLLSNFPAAGAIVYAAAAIESCYTVVIRNTSQKRLEDVHVVGGGCDVSFESIPPGDAARRHFWTRHDGSLVLRFKGTGPQTIDGYVTNGQGGHTTVTVHPDGTVSVDRESR